jgi:pilus assembly protein CpaE
MVGIKSDLPHNLVGFANDPVSEHIIASVIKEMNLAYAETRQGKISDVIEFMKNNRTPKILIVDISDSELPLGDVAKIREHSTPNLNIIVIGSRNDVGLFRDFMQMGISDYLVKPLNNSILRKAVEDANSGKKTIVEKTGKLIQVISSVGGAGATTLVTNIAWILANHHFKRSVVMDTDFLFGTANLMLDIKSENSYLDILESPEKIDDYFVETILRKHDQRLYYLGGLSDLAREVSVDLETFEALVRLIKKQFNYVIVDSQRGVNAINRTIMGNADMFVIMIEMSIASAQNTLRLLEFLNLEQQGKKVFIVANKVGLSSGGSLSKETFEKAIDRKINYVMPLDENAALASANIGQPLAASGNPLSEILENITDDILGKNDTNVIAKELLKNEGLTLNYVMNKVIDICKKVSGVIK